MTKKIKRKYATKKQRETILITVVDKIDVDKYIVIKCKKHCKFVSAYFTGIPSPLIIKWVIKEAVKAIKKDSIKKKL